MKATGILYAAFCCFACTGIAAPADSCKEPEGLELKHTIWKI